MRCEKVFSLCIKYCNSWFRSSDLYPVALSTSGSINATLGRHRLFFASSTGLRKNPRRRRGGDGRRQLGPSERTDGVPLPRRGEMPQSRRRRPHHAEDRHLSASRATRANRGLACERTPGPLGVDPVATGAGARPGRGFTPSGRWGRLSAEDFLASEARVAGVLRTC